jgi:hypothetical protein
MVYQERRDVLDDKRQLKSVEIILSAISISRDSITHNIKKERNTGISPCSSGMIRAGKERTKIDDSPGAIYKNTYEEEYF